MLNIFYITFQLTIQNCYPYKVTTNPITVSILPEPGESKVASQFISNFSKGDYIGMCSYLFDTDFSSLTSLDVEMSWNIIKSTILDAIDLFIPKIKTTTHGNQPVWFNSNIRHQIKFVQTLRGKLNSGSI